MVAQIGLEANSLPLDHDGGKAPKHRSAVNIDSMTGTQPSTNTSGMIQAGSKLAQAAQAEPRAKQGSKHQAGLYPTNTIDEGNSGDTQADDPIILSAPRRGIVLRSEHKDAKIGKIVSHVTYDWMIRLLTAIVLTYAAIAMTYAVLPNPHVNSQSGQIGRHQLAVNAQVEVWTRQTGRFVPAWRQGLNLRRPTSTEASEEFKSINKGNRSALTKSKTRFDQSIKQSKQYLPQYLPHSSSVDFYLNPAAATGNDILDFKDNKLHKAHYVVTTKSLYTDKETKFDLTEDRLHDFLTALKERTEEQALSTVEVPIDLANPVLAGDMNYIDFHGQFDEAHLKAYARVFLGQRNRAAQDDYMLYQLLMQSVTHEARAQLACDEDDYSVVIGGFKHKCGLLLLAHLIKESAADSSVDPDTIRQELAHAPTKFKDLKYSVEEFNKWVSLKMKILRRYGETSSDLRTHPMAAYKSSEDKEFVQYINSLKDQIRDTGSRLTPTEIMSMAKKKADDLEKDRKFMCIPTGGGADTIVALEARIRELEAAAAVAANGNANKKKRKPFPKELKTASAPEDHTKPRILNGVKYWHCPTHGKWGVHPQVDTDGIKGCTKYAEQQNGSTGTGGDTSDGSRQRRAVSAFSALTQVAQD